MNFHIRHTLNTFVMLTLLTSLLGGTVTVTPVHAAALQTDITGPSGSEEFGTTVTTLPNGNFVITDPYYDAPGPIVDVGAVYLYDGATHALISTLTGSTASDKVGWGGVTALTNGNYVVESPTWNGVTRNIGAVTWASGATGTVGAVSAANSLIGSTADDNVGLVTALSNGNYVVESSRWDGATKDVGAVTWGSGTGGTVGEVSAINSLIGSTMDDRVGNDGVTALPNGNYVVASPWWDGEATDVGAVTWGNGTSGTVGTVSEANSLVGSIANDWVGRGGCSCGNGVTVLTNGNYVVGSPWWNGAGMDVGAVTWGSGMTGTVGAVSEANSLVGSTASDYVSVSGVTALTNGNYVVASAYWDDAAIDVGAVTWGNGTSGTVGVPSAVNSLIGSTMGDMVGFDSGNDSVVALTNGNYVVRSSSWDGVAIDVGAVTWGSGMGDTVGAVSEANSLVGSTASDMVGYYGVTALANGNYAVTSYYWDDAATDVGAVTWGNGTGGTIGAVSAANSLVGSTADDNVGSVTALTNGNYVVRSTGWDGTAMDVGAVTWGNGTGGTVGAISYSNSLVGTTASDWVGYGGGVTALMNGNYVVASYYWDGAATDVGAVTWGSGTGGTVGTVSSVNSLVGSTSNDWVGNGGVMALTNGNYVVESYTDDVVGNVVGTVTWGNGTSGTVGAITVDNSVRGTASLGGRQMRFPLAYDYVNDQLVVGRPADNIVTLFKITLPSVTGSLRVNPSPTNLASVDFTVTFSEPVNGVDIVGPLFDDFALTTSPDISGTSITGVNGSGSTYTVTVNTGTGNGTIRLDVPVNATIHDLLSNSVDNLPFTSGQVYTIHKTLTPKSTAAHDGWLLESTETSGIGGTKNSASTFFYLGDNAARKQYRSILSFNTSSLPDNAIITKVTLKLKKQGVAGGGNPVTMFQGFVVDIKNGVFDTAPLALTDFKATASKTVGPVSPSLTSGWYNLNLINGKGFFNKLGITQIRLRFKLDDNNNAVANFLKIYSGNAGVANRPQLVIEYYVP